MEIWKEGQEIEKRWLEQLGLSRYDFVVIREWLKSYIMERAKREKEKEKKGLTV